MQFADKICNPFNEFFDNFKAILNINDVVFKYNSFDDVKSKKIYNHLFKSIISKSDFGPQKIYYRASQENDSNLLTMTSEYALNSKESKDVAVLTIDSKYTESLGTRNLLKLTAVVFDAIEAAKARNVDLLICDTAGRLHNKKNLMNELEKINRIIDRELEGYKKETLLVLDATTGQNAVIQAKQFMEACPIDGIILTKLDGTAKGGVVISIKQALNIPVRYIGVGEGIDDLQKFDAESFAEALI